MSVEEPSLTTTVSLVSLIRFLDSFILPSESLANISVTNVDDFGT